MQRFQRVIGRTITSATLLFVCAPEAAVGQAVPENGGRRTIVAARLVDGESITLDGRLNEPVWSRAVPGGDFIQIDPDNGMPATERTEVRIAFDTYALYLGITCYDSEPDGWIAYQRRRDEALPSDDKVRWTIDTFLDGRSGYLFEMNPLGHMADALLGINGNNRAWDGIWNARVSRSEIGWTLEVELPFRTFNFNPNSDTWGINFERTVQRKNEISIWMGWGRNQGLQLMTNAGLVTGIGNVTQGHGLDIKPYGVITSLASPGRGRPAAVGDANAGLDLFYNPTPELRTVFTLNTDFAQTEVDQRQVNLTRYSLFFPERRDFFLDGATFLDFTSDGNRRFGGGVGGSGGGSNDDQVNPFFSRRIGLSAGGIPQKIDFGAKVTGQMGAQDVGFLHVRTGEDEGLASEDFVVARVKRRVLAQSYVGGLYTRRDPRVSGAEARQTVGLDFSVATSEFRSSQNLEVNGWFLRASRPDGPGSRTAFGGTFDFPNDRWSARYETTQVEEEFDPAVGFIRRRNYRRYAPMGQFAPRPADHRYIRQIRFNLTLDVMTDLRNDLITRDIDATLLGINFHSQDYLAVSATRRRERLDDAFQITPDITLPFGAVYDFTRYRVFVQTANRRTLAVTGRIEAGNFYSGSRKQQLVNLTVRARPGLIVYLGGEWNSVNLPEGHFTTHLYRLVGETQFSPFLSLVNDVQYDTQSGVLGWQARFRWIVMPGSDVYVVYTHNWLEEPFFDRFATLDRRVASKVLYTYRF